MKLHKFNGNNINNDQYIEVTSVQIHLEANSKFHFKIDTKKK